jgi:PAS domain S-box-containing protein
VLFNKAAHSAFGYSSEEFASMRMGKIDLLRAEAEVAAVAEKVLDGESIAFGSRFLTKRHDLRDVFVMAQSINVGGEVRILALCMDITDR